MGEFAGIIADSLFAGGSLVVIVLLVIVLVIWKPWHHDD